jgi:hypothetical protein
LILQIQCRSRKKGNSEREEQAEIYETRFFKDKHVVIILDKNDLQFAHLFHSKVPMNIVLKRKGRQCFLASVHSKNSCISDVSIYQTNPDYGNYNRKKYE